MKDNIWCAEYKGHEIRVINKVSLFPPQTSELLEIDGVLIKHVKGSFLRFHSTILTKYNFGDVEKEVDIRIGPKSVGKGIGCHIYIDGTQIGGDRAILNTVQDKTIVMAPIKIKFTEQYIRKAIRFYWWHSVGSPYLFMLIPVTAYLTYRFATDDFTWFPGVLGFGVFFYSALMIILYFGYISQSLSQLWSMKVPEATLELEQEHFRITSNAGVTEIAWSSILDIWQSDKVWFLLASRHKIMTLPVAEITQEAKSFIISKIETVMYRTGQLWKIRTMFVCGYLSLFITFGPLLIDSVPDHWNIYFYTTGFIIAISGLILSFSIRCPICRSHWAYSHAARISYSDGWPNWLVALKNCPGCMASGDDFNRVADEVSLD